MTTTEALKEWGTELPVIPQPRTPDDVNASR
jgi:hypothetical protein